MLVRSCCCCCLCERVRWFFEIRRVGFRFIKVGELGFAFRTIQYAKRCLIRRVSDISVFVLVSLKDILYDDKDK